MLKEVKISFLSLISFLFFFYLKTKYDTLLHINSITFFSSHLSACCVVPPNRRTPTCGGRRCTWLPRPAQSSSQTSLWLPWRRSRLESRPSRATPTPSDRPSPRCMPRRESGRKCITVYQKNIIHCFVFSHCVMLIGCKVIQM